MLLFNFALTPPDAGSQQTLRLLLLLLCFILGNNWVNTYSDRGEDDKRTDQNRNEHTNWTRAEQKTQPSSTAVDGCAEETERRLRRQQRRWPRRRQPSVDFQLAMETSRRFAGRWRWVDGDSRSDCDSDCNVTTCVQKYKKYNVISECGIDYEIPCMPRTFLMRLHPVLIYFWVRTNMRAYDYLSIPCKSLSFKFPSLFCVHSFKYPV